MILCITPNPDVEYTWIVPSFQLGKTHHVQQAVIMPSGKGVNVARAIHSMGGKAMCAGFLGGHTGKYMESLIEQMEIPAKWTWIDGETRIAVAIIDTEMQQQDATLVSELGPSVTREDWLNLISDVLSINSKYACISGRLPGGSPLNEFGNLIRMLENQGTNVWIDTSGEGLREAMNAKPTGIKINAIEASVITGNKIFDVQSAYISANQILEKNIQQVVLTLGEKGAILVCHEGSWFAKSPSIPTISSVGSGDAFMAGLLNAYENNQIPPVVLREAVALGAANTMVLGGGNFDMKIVEELIPGIEVKPISSSN
ncbi:MAG: 1-phosphofructokinase family hexose kinase [Anaerolineaceae bacterium]|jgi:1-phosphofructokinase family hexose kinase|nr:1-phosphofructokinase family hexose kinase [Anaerolineaceae bacterium]